MYVFLASRAHSNNIKKYLRKSKIYRTLASLVRQAMNILFKLSIRTKVLIIIKRASFSKETCIIICYLPLSVPTIFYIGDMFNY